MNGKKLLIVSLIVVFSTLFASLSHTMAQDWAEPAPPDAPPSGWYECRNGDTEECRERARQEQETEHPGWSQTPENGADEDWWNWSEENNMSPCTKRELSGLKCHPEPEPDVCEWDHAITMDNPNCKPPDEEVPPPAVEEEPEPEPEGDVCITIWHPFAPNTQLDAYFTVPNQDGGMPERQFNGWVRTNEKNELVMSSNDGETHDRRWFFIQDSLGNSAYIYVEEDPVYQTSGNSNCYVPRNYYEEQSTDDTIAAEPTATPVAAQTEQVNVSWDFTPYCTNQVDPGFTVRGMKLEDVSAQVILNGERILWLQFWSGINDSVSARWQYPGIEIGDQVVIRLRLEGIQTRDIQIPVVEGEDCIAPAIEAMVGPAGQLYVFPGNSPEDVRQITGFTGTDEQLRQLWWNAHIQMHVYNQGYQVPTEMAALMSPAS